MDKDLGKKGHFKNTSVAVSSYQNHLATNENLISEFNDTVISDFDAGDQYF